MQEYSTVKNTVRTETVIERSRFIATIKRVESESAAKEFVDSVRKEFPDATHNCYAYITERGGYSRYSDDGEPSGTAGAPILEAIKNAGIFDTAIVVTRYFGGVKLGTGGLVRAYGGAATGAIERAGKAVMSDARYCAVELTYGDGGAFSRLVRFGLKVLSTEYTDGVKISFVVKKSVYNAFIRDFNDLFNGKYSVDIEKEEYYGF